MFVMQADGMMARAAGRLAKEGRPHPAHRAFFARHDLRCGFREQGFSRLAVGLFKRELAIGDENPINGLSSNLCLCAGYRTIVKAVRKTDEGTRKR
jgi:carbon-monoxide dehydrogenase small subunit